MAIPSELQYSKEEFPNKMPLLTLFSTLALIFSAYPILWDAGEGACAPDRVFDSARKPLGLIRSFVVPPNHCVP